jgi:hypothetical protein
MGAALKFGGEFLVNRRVVQNTSDQNLTLGAQFSTIARKRCRSQRCATSETNSAHSVFAGV